MADGSATWIAKPSITNQAIGICIFDRVSTLRAALEATADMREWVVQRCVKTGCHALQQLLYMSSGILALPCGPFSCLHGAVPVVLSLHHFSVMRRRTVARGCAACCAGT